MKKFIRMMLIGFLILSGTMCAPTPKAYAADKANEWKLWASGKIIDIDPLYVNELGLMIHLSTHGGTRSWTQVWKSNFVGHWPSIGEKGSFYSRKSSKNRKAEQWKWVIDKRKKVSPAATADDQKIKPAPMVVQEESNWQKVDIITPETDKVVVVRFDNGRTSTAYLNKYKEWKLDIDKDRYVGGKTIINIKEWKDAGI